MAERKLPIPEKIDDIDLEDELQTSFMEYALSVIHARALPDARDGLKPVQRRIIYQAFEMGLRPDRPFVKSARIVGEVMGKLHPHGDLSIYDALVRMAQGFTLNVPLIEGHGNFGSLDDSAAAPRYTEARLSAAAIRLTQDIDEQTVEFVPNYDNKLTQPKVLPAAFPNLLVNGASGIAVGMATNMAPHNLGETIRAAVYLLEHPDANCQDLMKFIPGPDLPSGAIILGTEGLKEAYTTGKGSFTMRAKVKIENLNARTRGIVVSELPYLVGPEKVIERLQYLLNQKKLDGIAYFKDLTDRKVGTRIVIAVKSGYSPEAILLKLFQVTPLQSNFVINNVALVDNVPETLSLKRLLEIWLEHRKLVTRQRTEFRLNKARRQMRLVAGLLLALLDLDRTIAIIRGAENSAQAKSELQEFFQLDEVQAEYILELKLRRLTKFSRIELEAEQSRLESEIRDYERLLSDVDAFISFLKSEMMEVAVQLESPRRSEIIDVVQSSTAGSESAQLRLTRPNPTSASAQMPDRPCSVILSSSLLIGQAIPSAELVDQTLPETAGRSVHDAVRCVLRTSTGSEIGAITNFGRVHKFPVAELPVLDTARAFSGLDGTSSVNEYLTLDKRETVLNLVALDSSTPIALGTKFGTVKRVLPEVPKSASVYSVIRLDDADEVVGASHARDGELLVFISRAASLLVFPSAKVRPQGRASQGMSGMKLNPSFEGDSVIFFGPVSGAKDTFVVTITASAKTAQKSRQWFGKTTPLTEYPTKGRATSGVRTQKLLKGQSALTFAYTGPGPLGALNAAGLPVELPPLSPKRDASGSRLADTIESIGFLLT